jgi:hypothetical protein
MIGKIIDTKVEVQHAFVIVDVLATRLDDFEVHFVECLNISLELMKFVLKGDTAVLRPVMHLLKSLTSVNSRMKYEGREILELCGIIRNSLRTFEKVESIHLFAYVKGALEIFSAGVEKKEEFRVEERSDLVRRSDSSDGEFSGALSSEDDYEDEASSS